MYPYGTPHETGSLDHRTAVDRQPKGGERMNIWLLIQSGFLSLVVKWYRDEEEARAEAVRLNKREGPNSRGGDAYFVEEVREA